MLNIKFEWAKDFKSRRQNGFSKAQKIVDTAAIEHMTRYAPVADSNRYAKAGMLRDSVKNPEPGLISYTAPFARVIYYEKKGTGSKGNPQGRGRWFEYMKAVHKNDIKEKLRESGVLKR